MGRSVPCSIGHGGARADKQEGDGATPIGAFALGDIYFRSDRLAAHALPAGSRAIRRRDIWCDDPSHPHYNCLSRCGLAAGERLFRADRLYDLIVVVLYNANPVRPHLGSAIFLHAWRRPGQPTEGCVAFDPTDLMWIIRHLEPHSRLIVRRIG